MTRKPLSGSTSASHTRSTALVPVFWAVGVAVLLVALGLIGGALWLYYTSPQTDVLAGEPVRVKIERGSSTREIAEALLEAGVISNAQGFALQSRLTGSDGRLQPGTYDFATRTANGEVIAVLKEGPTVEYVTVTIPEGFRLDQIADRLNRQVGISRKKFLALAENGAPRFAADHPYLAGAYKDSLEGYLFPKTYEFHRGMSAAQAIEMMLDQFDREVAGLDMSRARERGLSPQQVVVLASMIERESRLDEERPLVSSVIYNRLDRGMRLKIDATIEYVLRDRKLRLSNADLYTRTPYNTYLHEGLPPGPISNPGLASLRAAAAPADTDFLYYVLTGKDGSHTFTTNLADFLVAKKKSKEVFGR